MPYPKWNTVPIKCGNRKCKWTGMEADLKQVPEPDPNPLRVTNSVCPECGGKSYRFITKR